MAKIETAQQLTARKAKEQKELARWRNEQSKPKGKGYLIYLLVVLCMVYVADSIATDICTQMKAEICQYLFDGSTAVMDTLSMMASAVMICAALYKTLSDRFGRKPFLIINTIAMGIGMFIVYFAGALGSSVVYIIGSLFITFFIAHDMQVVYIMETVPSERRATYLSVIQSVASLGAVLIPIMRRMFMGNETQYWNRVFIFPAIVCIIIGLLALLCAKETDSFATNRIAYLEMSDEERRQAADKKKAEANAQGGLLTAFKFAFRHKQLRWLFICTMVISVAMIGTMYYQQIMTYGYQAQFGEKAPEMVTDALMVTPVLGAFFTLIRGPIGDRFGRKTVGIVMVALSLVGISGFFLGVTYGWSPVLVGVMVGFYISGYWGACDIMGGIMCAESAPTNLRASIIGAQTLCSMVGMGISFPAMIVASIVAGNDVLGIACVSLVAPALLIALALFLFNVHETKGINLSKVRGDEWD